MKTLSIIGLTLLAVTTFASAAEVPVVARIGNMEVKTSDLVEDVGRLNEAQQAALTQNPAALNQAVRSLLVRRLVLKEALGRQWQSRPEVEEQLKRLRDAAIVDSYLQSVSEPPASYPTDAELQAAYEENKAALQIPRQFQLSQIFLAVPKNASKEVEEKAQARLDLVLKKLKEKASFAEVAAQFSDEKSGDKGAGLPWLSESQFQPGVRDVIKGLQKGAVSKPLKIDDGWHIIKVVDDRDARTASFVEVRELLRQRLRAERRRADGVEYINGLVKDNPVSINELELGKLLQSSDR